VPLDQAIARVEERLTPEPLPFRGEEELRSSEGAGQSTA